jgi:hypothetical protein
MIVLIIILILIEAPILLLHEWNHDHRPSSLLSAIGLTGPPLLSSPATRLKGI